ncbi:MAG: YXWGXW repeat-containing protein, partial [Gammaproteobacteria bacterium]|nr:YXWGXW repeat-containing protein [Gammaproteobacteria bacterium]
MRTRLLRGLIPSLALAALPAISSAGVFIGVSVNIAPPPLPIYVQPPCPEPGYIWTPGYWAWNDGAYYWVPGTWVLPPEVGLLWTPGYWGWDDDGDDYVWHAGYWGPHVGFYGGVNYGFGYDGEGFAGGYWRGGLFFYNRAVWHVGPTFVTNVYYHPVEYHRAYEHVSFNGGPGGVEARPTRSDFVAEHEHHFAFTSGQQKQQRMAFADHSLRADYNHGRPPIAATARPAMFHGNGAFAARAAGGPVHLGPSREAAPMRSDRPSWATGQSHSGRSMERPMQRSDSLRMHAQPNYERPQQRYAPQQRFESRPQNNFQGYRPMERPQARPEPQFHQQFRPQPQDYRPAPQFH